jgi:hypothetical protein
MTQRLTTRAPVRFKLVSSFQLADAPPICFSIELRKEIGESYLVIRGFF